MFSDSGRQHRRLVAFGVAAAASCVLAWAGAPGASAAQVNRAREQAATAKPAPVKVLVVFYSATGNTEKMARAVAEGVRSVPGAGVTVKACNEVTAEDVEGADGMVLGSPTYWGNMAAQMKAFIDGWAVKYDVSVMDKVGGAFASGGDETGGKENVIHSLELAMLNGGMIIAGPLQGHSYGTAGVSAVSPVNEEALKRCRALGRRIADVARRMRKPATGE